MSVENLKIKAAVIEEIKEKLEKAESAVVVDYIGTTVEQANALRKNLREAGVDYTVYKNTLMAKAVEGTKYEDLKNVFSGPSALAISYDDATRTLTIGKREGKFPGMLQKRRFNVVFVTPDQPRQLDLDAPEGRMVEYAGKPVIVRL